MHVPADLMTRTHQAIAHTGIRRLLHFPWCSPVVTWTTRGFLGSGGGFLSTVTVLHPLLLLAIGRLLLLLALGRALALAGDDEHVALLLDLDPDVGGWHVDGEHDRPRRELLDVHGCVGHDAVVAHVAPRRRVHLTLQLVGEFQQLLHRRPKPPNVNSIAPSLRAGFCGSTMAGDLSSCGVNV